MQNVPAKVYPHNIHHEVAEVVKMVREDSIGGTVKRIWLITAIAFVAVCFVHGAPLSALVPVLFAGFAGWMASEQITLPSVKLQDKHLALLAEIGFNEREAGKCLKILLNEKGFLTYSELRYAQEQYDIDNAREYRLRETGAKTFLAVAP
jgi:hypothetical protein